VQNTAEGEEVRMCQNVKMEEVGKSHLALSTMSKIAATGSILPKALLVICAMLKDREPSKCDGNE